MADFSGYVAADELYDGPFCILSAVDNRRYKRLLYDVLDHDPTHEDIRAFLGRLKTALAARGLTLCGCHHGWLGALSRTPQRRSFGEVPHQICAVSCRRRGGQSGAGGCGQRPQEPGSPTTQTASKGARVRQQQSRRPAPKKRLEAQRADLFTHRYLFVKHHLSQSERKTFWRITRGRPQLRKLREIMEQVYTLFDRRCRTQTALDKLAKLRRRLQRFKQLGETLKKLFSPTLEKALTFLDDTWLPSTSNAVERGNRRYRKMQKQVYRVRTQAQVSARLALDMWREAQGAGRHQTLHTLHEARAA